VDTQAQEVVKKIPVGLQPDGVAVSPDGMTIYVANSGTNDVSLIDFLDLKEIRRAKVGKKPFSLTVDNQGRVFVVETQDKAITIYDSEFKKVGSFQAKKKPVDIKLSQDNRLAFVTDEKDNRLLVFDIP
jgi:YVTN family beta-propeller protein